MIHALGGQQIQQATTPPFLGETAVSLVAYCRENDRVCPQPMLWQKLWES
jgi:hypothetical protein